MEEKMVSFKSICEENVRIINNAKMMSKKADKDKVKLRDPVEYYQLKLEHFKELLDGFGINNNLLNGYDGGTYNLPESQREYIKELLNKCTNKKSYFLIRSKNYYKLELGMFDEIIGKFVQFLKATVSPSSYEDAIIKVYEKTQYSFIKQLKLTEAKMLEEVQKNLINTFKDSKVSRLDSIDEPLVSVLSTEDIACLVEHYRYLMVRTNKNWVQVLNNYMDFRNFEDAIERPDIKEPYQKVLEDSIRKAVDINELTILYDDLASF